MPFGRYFSFDINVGGQCLKEHEVDSKQYISVDLHSTHSYVVEEAEQAGEDEQQYQKYPVTPFKIVIQKQYDYPCWFTIFMDGERVSSFPITRQGRSKRTVDGYKSGNEIRELAFSLPRISHERTLTKRRQDFAGTFRIICEEAIPHHMETVLVPSSVNTNMLPQTTTYPQLTKRDVTNVQGGMGVVCREGRTFKQLSYENCSYRKRIRLTRGSILEEMTLHYRSKEVLQEMGVVPQDLEREVTAKLTEVHINGTSSNQKDSRSSAIKDGRSSAIKDGSSSAIKDGSSSAIKDGRLSAAKDDRQSAVKDGRQSAVKDGRQSAKTDKENVDQENVKQTEMTHDEIPTLTMKQELMSSRNEVYAKNEVQVCNGDFNVTKELKQEQINVVTSTPFGKVPMLNDIPHSPISVKHEQMRKDAVKANLIEVKSELFLNSENDDDVVYVDTTYIKRESGLDDSVIYMGDDSCYEVDIPEEEVSVMDLCEED